MADPIQTVDEPGREPATPVPADPSPQPERIGRYRVERLLGQGGFGLVYLARDDRLSRPVAIKVPHAHLLARAGAAEAYLAEARNVANLDHPNIVPVFDVGSTDLFPCYSVSKYIDGTDLGTRLSGGRLSLRESVELAAAVAEALHYAHKQGLVHRDVKPANILLDQGGKPFVADFGLALREEDTGRGPRHAGTPAYMSPEQARGEGHRVDGRSDVFGLGIVVYELLTGRRPFRGDSREELLEQIASREARPPRQVDDTIPKELERICLKALGKRASDRYTTAKDMADDLRHFLAGPPPADKPAVRGPDRHEPDAGTPLPSPVLIHSDQPVSKVVPKGLRSFDAGDADFFLELLPGPRDREGLPAGIRFWKSRIETGDPDGTFPVGLLYGPSGCGKSSLVKAGLLPRLATSVTAVYVEATARETEARLLKNLRRQVPGLPPDLGVAESLAELRQGRILEPGRKVLLVLDQFEQWLHATRGDEDTKLVHALRQCDGGRVQAVVLVRDDFWMAATRFMADLEVSLSQGRNCAAVDLFDLPHARNVLAGFGRAYGRLPDNLGRCSKEQQAFLDQAVAGLAQDGQVVPVRLALFAEMVKGKPWTPAALKEVGGAEGVGVRFLAETFAAATAPPQCRLHREAAQAVLTALLPPAGTDLKGHMRSHRELLAASGYGTRPKDFDELIRILDGEIRLITPTDPEGREGQRESGVVPPRGPDARHYQLTHDYLVPSLRDWLTRQQKETRRGRAGLLLADRAAAWTARPESRQLPSLPQWLGIRWLTRKGTWTPPQRGMMRRAARYHAARAVAAAVLLAVTAWGAYEGHGRMQAHALGGRLLDADTAEVPGIVRDMAPYRRWLDPLLRDAFVRAEADNDRRRQLHAGLALLPTDATQVGYLYGRLLDAEPGEVPVVRDALAPHKEALLGGLWAVVEAPPKGQESRRMRAAAALATYDPWNERWARSGALVVNDLIRENAIFLGQWGEAFRPVRGSLLGPLAAAFRDQRPGRAAERTLATNILADYAADRPHVLADLLMDADDRQFAVIYPKLRAFGERGLPALAGETEMTLPPDLPSADERRERLAKRQANAAVALLKMGRPERVWSVLAHRPDPRVRSYLIDRLGPLGADARAAVGRLADETDVTVRRALLLCLGEYREEDLAADARRALLPMLQEVYRTADDPGLHAAAEWLLRAWRQDAWLEQVTERWARDPAGREKRLRAVGESPAKGRDKAPPQWYVNGQGQTMVVIPGPVEFVMGSPPTEADRKSGERQHTRRIGRTFALAASPVTKEQYLRFHPGFAHDQMHRYPDRTCPIGRMSWYEAAKYCNWLSEQEGIAPDQWCYETDPRGRVTGLKGSHLSLTGYRLPTEAEVEYACRAGAVTSRYYGETEELLPKYGWYHPNSDSRTWPVGGKKPNDLGLFDTLGNVMTWCQDAYKEYPAATVDPAVEDGEGVLTVDPTASRIARGGSFPNRAPAIRCAFRTWFGPSESFYNVGIRPARTFMP